MFTSILFVFILSILGLGIITSIAAVMIMSGERKYPLIICIILIFIFLVLRSISIHHSDELISKGEDSITSNVKSLEIEDFNDWFSDNPFKGDEIENLDTTKSMGISEQKMNYNSDRSRWEYSYRCSNSRIYFYIDGYGNCSSFTKRPITEIR